MLNSIFKLLLALVILLGCAISEEESSEGCAEGDLECLDRAL